MGCSRSKDGVVAPRAIVATYSLVSACNWSIRFVARPVQTIITPVARGSRVPAWPTFSFLTPRLRHSAHLTLPTKSNEVHL